MAGGGGGIRFTLTLCGGANEPINYSGAAAGSVTLDASGTATLLDMPRGLYHFSGSYVADKAVEVSADSVIWVVPDGVTPLYWHGNKCEGFSGGWVGWVSDGSDGSAESSYYYVHFLEQYVDMFHSWGANCATLRSAAQANTAGRTLKMLYTFTKSGSAVGYEQLMLIPHATDDYSTSELVSAEVKLTKGTSVTIPLDVSSVPAGYVKVVNRGFSSGDAANEAHVFIYAIWLEEVSE